LAYFTHLKCQKRIEDDVGGTADTFLQNKKDIFWGENDSPGTFYPPYYARI
jgi:hypothetical protein